jgi:hypothetical protein
MQRHDFDPVAFIFGIAFSGLGVLFMTDRLDLLNHAQWLWPGLLVLLGLAVLVGARGRGGARAPRPAIEPRVPIDPAREDELLHAPMRTIDSEPLTDTRDLFTLRLGTPKPEAEEEAAAPQKKPEQAEAPKAPEAPAVAATAPEAPAAPEKPAELAAAATAPLPEAPEEPDEEPEAAERRTEGLPKADPDADTTVLPEPEAKREPDQD